MDISILIIDNRTSFHGVIFTSRLIEKDSRLRDLMDKIPKSLQLRHTLMTAGRYLSWRIALEYELIVLCC